jgi:hypothetical protein
MPKKKDLNPEKREEICNRLLEILGLDDNNCFIRSDMDENEEKQQQIIDMKPEIKEYFACAKIAAFKPNFHVQRPYLSIVTKSGLHDNWKTIHKTNPKQHNATNDYLHSIKKSVRIS